MRAVERGHVVTTIDPMEFGNGFFLQLMDRAYFHYKDGEAIPEPLEEAARVLRAADA